MKFSLDIEKFIDYWNARWPIDRWYRKKYGIAFGSKQHKELNFITMTIDLKEELTIKRTGKQEEHDFFYSEIPADVTGTGEPVKFTKPKKMKQSEIDKEFDDIDIVKLYNESKAQ